ncbi:hypothetical protein HKBW3S44_00174 [Candidatus Hakubella thermalkaliphila]|uniref:PglZ domain-containing protein n=1 Tax=Candidatus Hakubella thermalkaliphila TaxID=2754717 RepID=A0A6V8Q0M6_9ACTN|nr:PglZ domain-containing protein [Candidatus Hakubella thermalkaliphila]GFP36491.1 hypothetical protein HKBW3S44_00174 [Candidatus Hakubella thermalkaliphila]
MISVMVDPYGLSEEIPTVLVVRDESQFIDSRLKIRDALHKGKDLNVIIKNRRIGQWYESLRDYPDVKIEILSPSSVLSRALNLSVSLSLNLSVNDSEIQELGLVEKVEKNLPQTRLVTTRDIESWVLSVCVGECWGEKGGTLTHFAEMASFFLNVKELQKHPALARLMKKQEEGWFDSPVGEIYKWLFMVPRDRSFFIYAWQILKNYDKTMRENILDEITKRDRQVLEPLEKCVEQIPLIECKDDYKKKSELSDLLEMKWKNILKSKLTHGESENDETLKKRFGQIIGEAAMKMSGRIAGEINAVSFFVRENPFYFSKDLFDLIGARFTVFQKQVEELSQFIPPRFPTEPRLDWDWGQMSKWATSEYFPYKKWSIQQGRRDKKIEEIAETYSEWLHRKYPQLKNQLSPLIYGTWYRIKKHIAQGYRILWIIIDNLSWFYLKDIIKAFKEEKLFCSSEPIPCLSMLPSETKISKTALVAGKLPNQIEVDKYQKYTLLFEDFCKQSNMMSYKAIPDSEFRKSKLEEHQVTCCIINKLDISSHGGFFDLEDEIKDFLKRIAQYVRNFLPRDLSSKKFYLVISTDHGCCIIPQNIKGLGKPGSARMEKEHKRFVYVDSNQHLDKNWYFLDKDKFGLPESIAIAKGYRFVGKRKPKGLIHGGMTPEETVIPHLEFCLQPLELKDIQVYHSSSPIIGTRKQKVELSNRNLNDYEISNVAVYVPSHSIEIKIEKIPAKDEVSESCEITLSREEVIGSKDNIVTLRGFYSFDCMGEPKRGEVEVKIKIRKIIEGFETAEEIFKS